MNIPAIYHQPQSAYGFNRDEHTFVIRLRVGRYDKFSAITLVYGMKFDFQHKREQIEMKLKAEDEWYAYYESVLTLNDSRLAYIFILNTGNSLIYYSEKGVSGSYNYELSYYDFFQMPYTNKVDLVHIPLWSKSAVFYQIFVDRFNIGNQNKNLDYINLTWGSKPTPKSFLGGDLAGVYNKLDYLQDLGVNALYLTPINLSPSNHKYDVIDYYKVDPMFGDLETLKKLIDELHQRNMHIVLDAVFNHCSNNHPYFLDVIKHGKDSKYYDYFIIDGDEVSTDPLNYQTFAKVKYMPKWNTSNPKVQDYLIKIGLYYIKELKIDGWRLDVADEVSHTFWKKFRMAIKDANPDALIIGESWHESGPWLQGDEFDGIMNYSFTKALFDYYVQGVFDCVLLSERLNTILMRYPDNINQMMLNLLDSHDTHRFYTLVDENVDKLTSALALTVMFPGIPCMYYGTEVPLAGNYDPDCRRTMPWGSGFEQGEHFKLVQKILKLKEQKALASYEYEITSNDHRFYLIRGDEDEKIVFITGYYNKPLFIPEAAEILVSNKYKDNWLDDNGFVVYKIRN